MHYGRVGRQTIENTRPLTRKRMETIDEEFLAAAKDFIERQHKAGTPWLCYFNSTRMHVWTHLKPESQGTTGLGVYPDGMVETDGHVGQLLELIDRLGIADNTIVVYTTDNGAEVMSWPDGGSTPFRGEKATNWEGGFRVPCVIRWPGVIQPGTVVNDMCAHEDFLPTFAAAAGEPDLVDKIRKGHTLGARTFKVHLDGHNLLPFLRGGIQESPRRGFLYWSDDGDLLAIRAQHWKVVFKAQEHTGFGVWAYGFTDLRFPRTFNLRADPFERGDESIFYDKWLADRMFVVVPAQAIATQWLSTFKEFPPRQKPATFNLESVMDRMSKATPQAA
jgi:arylsulfatase